MLNNELLMASYIRGYIIKNNISYSKEIISKYLYDLTTSEILLLTNFAKDHNLKIYHFKEKEILPRVKIVLGFLRGIMPERVLDVGSGRGAFLFPFLNEFINTKVLSIDILDKRVEFLSNLSLGGVKNLTCKKLDITLYDYETELYDCVTMLEVLEHIPNVEVAIKNAIKLTKKYIVITVPAKKDDNPEHIHLLTKEKLSKIFNENGINNLKFTLLKDHLLLIAYK